MPFNKCAYLCMILELNIWLLFIEFFGTFKGLLTMDYNYMSPLFLLSYPILTLIGAVVLTPDVPLLVTVFFSVTI